MPKTSATASTSTAVVNRTYSPASSTFLYPKKGQFTHFIAGNTFSTFGMSCADLNKKQIEPFFNKFTNENSRDTFNHPSAAKLFNKVAETAKSITAILNELSAESNSNYSGISDIAQQVIDCDHIPIMLSKIAPASSYKRAARSISVTDVQTFLGTTPGSTAQAREFCAKNDIMKLLAELLQFTIDLRYTIPLTDKAFILCNRLVIGLEADVILPNEKSMPKEYVQFDLCETMRLHIYDLVCEMNGKHHQTKTGLIDPIFQVLRRMYGNTVTAQETATAAIYDIISRHVDQITGGNQDEEVTMSVEQDEMLQDVLPLIAYLNSTRNPFARNALYGQVVTNEAYKAALDAYRSGEEQQSVGTTRNHPAYQHREDFMFTQKTRNQIVEFDEDQIAKLLDGTTDNGNRPATKKNTVKGLFGAITRRVTNMITDGASSSNSANFSLTGKIRKTLELPAPAQYQTTLMITAAPDDNAATNSTAIPLPSAPRKQQ